MADAYCGRGSAYSCKGKPEKAIADDDEAIRLEPRRPDGYILRGWAHAIKGEPDKAVADFDEAVAKSEMNRAFV